MICEAEILQIQVSNLKVHTNVTSFGISSYTTVLLSFVEGVD